MKTTDGRADTAAMIEPPIASPTSPDVAVLRATADGDLETRINVRRTELIDKIGGLRGDRRREAAESRDKLRAKLSELAHMLRWGVTDGWASLGVPLTSKLEQWLAESARQLTAKTEQP